jgi:ferredoxin
MKVLVKGTIAMLLALGMLSACDGGTETVESNIKETTADEIVSSEKESDASEVSSNNESADDTEKASESIAAALERAGLRIHTACRSGSCGVCRIKVISGEYYVNPENDGRRGADKDFNYVHACSTYPLSDLCIKLNI